MNHPAFTIILPTWNNLPMLQLCCRSIRQHSAVEHQIVIHINDGSDGTLEWVQEQAYAYTHSPENIGICHAVNRAFEKAEQEYIVYLNDDMYVLPNWDTALLHEIATLGTTPFMLSATMIEPTQSGNACVIHRDYGRSPENFREEALLSEYQTLEKSDWSGASWPPLLIRREAWEAVGGFSVEFSPGMYSDPDLSMKLWQNGCRIFKGVAASRVYHFQAGSTGRVKKNNGRLQFMQKWGIPASTFYRSFLKMGQPFQGALSAPSNLLWAKLKAKFHQISKR